MRFGCCTNMVAAYSGGTGIEHIEDLAKIGYDYIELPLAQIMDLQDEAFAVLKHQVEASHIPCEVCNNFFPAHIRLTGNKTNKDEISKYVEEALIRAAQLGVRIIVFGSSGAKNVPEDFPFEIAWNQLVRLLQDVSESAKRWGITVVIEPLNQLESNIINTVEEGLKLARDVDRKNIKLLVDYYHLVMEKENLSVINNTEQYIRHVHFANPDKRVFPLNTDTEDYSLFFSYLKRSGYRDRISIEAYSKDLYKDAAASLKLLKKFLM